MMDARLNADSLIFQQPGPAMSGLVLLTHGVGSVPQSMAGVAQWFARHDPGAFVVSVPSAHPSDMSNGRQWFSVRGVTEQNRPARVAEAMPAFVEAVRHWQRETGMDAQRTTIAGFSQGAIMALESTQLALPVAARIVAMAGRFAAPPQARPSATIHLLHGAIDQVIPAQDARDAHAWLVKLDAEVTLDVVDGIGHEPHPALLERLAGHWKVDRSGR